MTLLKENGDFRSDECIELLKESDIVVTNPPFSLFREYIEQLVTYEKKFLIIGNQNAITYKEVFSYLKKKWRSLGNICWFTNLDISKRHEKLILYKKYSTDEYPKYDNFNAINVNKV